MASIQRYSSVRHGRLWRVQYRDAAGVSRTKSGFRTKAAAAEWAARNTVSLRDGSWTPPEMRRRTVAHYHGQWKASLLDKAPSTLEAYDAAWRVHVAPKWASYQVGAVRRADVQAWVSGMAASSGASVVRRAFFILSASLTAAVADGAIAVSPCSGVRLPSRSRRVPVPLTPGQVAALAAAVPKDVRVMVFVLAYTGIRWGECAALRVGDVRLDDGRLDIHRTASTVNGVVVVGAPKGGKGRVVAVPAPLLPLLEELVRGREHDALLWPGADGGPRRNLSQTQGWRRAVRVCRAADPSFPALTVHDLRHTAASMMISSGASVLAVQSQLGHSSASLTLDIYSHLMPDDVGQVAKSLSGVVVLS